MAVALNQADLLAPAELATCVDDLRRLLAEDGVGGVPVIAASAVTGEGLDTLRRLLAERVDARTAAAQRLAADVDLSAAALLAQCGEGRAHGVQREDRERLEAALAEAAGVPTVVRAVDAAHRRRGALATGWPFVRWLKRLRPDPLRRLRLPETPQELVKTSLPGPTDVQRARAHSASRALADRASEGLPEPWPRHVRAAAVAREAEVADRLDRAVAGTDLRLRRPRWWRVAGALQTVVAIAVAVGALWLLALLLLSYLQLDDVIPVPESRGIPLPTALLLGGALAGIALAFLSRIASGVGARRRARRRAGAPCARGGCRARARRHARRGRAGTTRSSSAGARHRDDDSRSTRACICDGMTFRNCRYGDNTRRSSRRRRFCVEFRRRRPAGHKPERRLDDRRGETPEPTSEIGETTGISSDETAVRRRPSRAPRSSP